jgi:hypothetical protein
MERGCVEDQRQRVGKAGRGDTAALRENTL